jgi:hypothetical protein
MHSVAVTCSFISLTIIMRKLLGLWGKQSYYKKVKLSLCLTTKGPRHEGVWGSRYADSYFIDLGTSWRWVVSFTPRPLSPPGKKPPVPIRKEAGWAPEPVRTTWRKFLSLLGLERWPLGRPARRQSLYRLPDSYYCIVLFSCCFHFCWSIGHPWNTVSLQFLNLGQSVELLG